MQGMLTFVPISTISLLVALVLILGMFGIKASELKRGRRSWLSRMGSGTDHFFTNIAHKIARFFSYFNRRTAIALTQWIAYKILSALRATYHKLHDLAHLHPHTKRVIDMVHGRAEVGNGKRGAPSAYLRRVSEESKEVKDGESRTIEDGPVNRG
jgi:hypothetical protein